MNSINSSFLPSTASFAAPSLSESQSFLRYMQEIQKFPMLTPEEEYDYATKFVKNGDKNSAKMLVQSHLRLVVKIAGKFKNYGLPIADLVSEGNVGLVQAVKKFDPIKGFRFSTYAMWWIRAQIQEYVLRSWSLVKIGTTAAQRKLFFNLSKIKKKILSGSDSDILPYAEEIAQSLNVSKQDVMDMDSRLSNKDSSLNDLVGDSEEKEFADTLVANEITQEQIAINNQERSHQVFLFNEAFQILNQREKEIIAKRQMTEKSATLDELSKFYKVSRERIRQIEAFAIEKIKKEVSRLQQKTSLV